MHSSGKLIDGRFLKVAKIGEGSSGKVYLVQKVQGQQKGNENLSTENNPKSLQKGNKTYFALKKLKDYGKNSQIVNKEIEILTGFSHPNIIQIEEVFVVQKEYKKSTYVVMQHYFELMDLFKIKEVGISDVQQKQILWSLVKAIEYIHDEGYLHRDIKPSNVLISKSGEVRLADFDISTKVKPQMTRNMTTRHYRAPQIMFGAKNYSFEVDIWSLGCTICEMILHEPIFPGETDISQLQKIFQVLGSPSKYWPSAEEYPFYLNFQIQNQKGIENILPIQNPQLLDLVRNLLVLDPRKRLSIAEVKSHPYFKDVNEDMKQFGKVCSYVYNKRIKEIRSI